MDYVKRLRLCIRWFQELELDYAFEQEKLKNAMELNEKHCADLGVFRVLIHLRIYFYTAGSFMDILGFKKKGNSTCLCLLAEVSLKEKEVELNLVIHELRKNFSSVQVQLAKEQAEKLVRICKVPVKTNLWLSSSFVVF